MFSQAVTRIKTTPHTLNLEDDRPIIQHLYDRFAEIKAGVLAFVNSRTMILIDQEYVRRGQMRTLDQIYEQSVVQPVTVGRLGGGGGRNKTKKRWR